MRGVFAEARLPHGALPTVDIALPRPTLAISAIECADHAHDDRCRYQVAWSINPHMSVGAVDYARASAQHQVLVAVLDAAGAKLEALPFVHAAYDSVFVKDPALLLSRRGQRRAVLARFRHPERTAERTARALTSARQGFEVVSDDHGPVWEGGDVVMMPNSAAMFLGTGLRTELDAAAWLERHAGVQVWPLELTDPHLYHLDMALAILPDGTGLVCPAALTPPSLRKVEEVLGSRKVIHVSREIALDFSLNLIAVGDTVVLGARDHRLAKLVTSLGYRCVVVPLGQFHLAGGSAACLVASVHRDPHEPT